LLSDTLLRDSWKDLKGKTSGNIRRLVLIFTKMMRLVVLLLVATAVVTAKKGGGRPGRRGRKSHPLCSGESERPYCEGDGEGNVGCILEVARDAEVLPKTCPNEAQSVCKVIQPCDDGSRPICSNDDRCKKSERKCNDGSTPKPKPKMCNDDGDEGRRGGRRRGRKGGKRGDKRD